MTEAPMTSPLPVKVPTREQCDAALGYLRTSYESVLSMMAKEWRGEEFHRRELACNFPKAAAALGLRLSADEEAAQHPSDLVKRLRSDESRAKMWSCHPIMDEAAARIEALEAAAAQPSPEIGLYEAIAHGDDIHRAWLKEALENWFAGKPVPPPRSAAPQPSREAELVKAAQGLRAATDGRYPPHTVSEQHALSALLAAIGAYDTPDAGRELDRAKAETLSEARERERAAKDAGREEAK